MSAQDERERRRARFGNDMSLRVRTARGTIINGLFLLAVNLLSLLRGFVVAAFLSTEEYGTWAVVLVMLATILALRQVGISEKYVQQDDEDQARAFAIAFTLELTLACAFAVLGAVFVLVAATIYGLPEIIAPGLVILATVPAVALQAPLFIFYRRMDFKRQRLLQGVDPIVAFVVTLAAAIAGASYWSLVIGTVAGAAAGAAVAVWASPHQLRLQWDSASARAYFGFSWPLFCAALSTVVTAQGLVAAGHAAVGLAGLGIIAISAQISQVADRADRAITDTLYPAICAVKDRVDLLLESFRVSNRLALMWALPFGAGVALFAHDLLVRVLGPEWENGVTLVQATAVTLAIHQIGFNWQAFYRARGDTRPVAVNALVSVVTFGAIIVPLLLLEGLDGLALGIFLAEIVHLGVRLHFLRRLFPSLNLWRHVSRAAAPCLPPVALVLGLRLLEEGERGIGIAAAEASLYIAVTIGLTLALERPLLRDVAGYLRGRPGVGVAAV